MSKKKIDRSLIPGDEWLYYKIYTGPKTADAILVNGIRPVSQQLLQDKIIDQWFFIRYSDPKNHLRVRFRALGAEHIGSVINKIHPYFKSLVGQDLVWKVQIDTYHREMERYGSNTMELSEQLFFHDSTCIVDFLDMIEGDEGEELRWLFALRGMDTFLDTFGFSDEEKLNLLDRLKTGFGIEFGMSRALKKQLDDKYRAESKKIDRFMLLSMENASDYLPILQILETRKSKNMPIAVAIMGHQQSGTLQLVLNDLMASYLHMFMNRLFKSNNRLHELVCYDFLYRYYKSKIARKKYQKSNAVAKSV